VVTGEMLTAAALLGVSVLAWSAPIPRLLSQPPQAQTRGDRWSAPFRRVIIASRRLRRRAACIELLEALAAELRAGRAASVALERAARAYPDLIPGALGAMRLGGDLPNALEQDSIAIAEPVLRRLAACWRVGQDSGAGLADAVTRLAAATRESERIRLDLASRTAEPKATMRLLAVLPVFGVVMGIGLGADTIGWLLGTSLGRLTLTVGVGLDLLGVLWTHHMIRGIERQL
jgi:tight adherence protein B